MSASLKKCLLLSCLAACLAATGCTHYQSTKNVWKGTKSLWNEYCSPPASIDYDDKGEMSETEQAIVNGMMGVDVQLTRLERVMVNSDRPPTHAWMNELFSTIPWIDGFAGIKANGTLLGQQAAPGKAPKVLDFNRILWDDEKLGAHTLRCDVQMLPDGPEVVVGVPLHDGVDFLGVVASYFQMKEIMPFAKSPDSIVVLTPYALLWGGRYDFAATPLAGVDWLVETARHSHGSVSNSNGTFAYVVRYFGNLPIVFAVPESGSFAEGHTDPASAARFFAAREKVAPPPVKEREGGEPSNIVFGKSPEEVEAERMAAEAAAAAAASQPSPEEQRRMQMQAQERQRRAAQAQARRRQQQARPVVPIIIPDEPEPEPRPQFKAPSPFGPRHNAGDDVKASSGSASQDVPQQQAPAKPESAAPAQQTAPAPASAPAPKSAEAAPASSGGDTPRATLPGGRPSPFGPRHSTTD